MENRATHVERRKHLSREEFYRDYVDRKPVIIEGVASEWAATSKWTSDYFRRVAPELRVKVKAGYLPKGETALLPLGRYLDLLDQYEEKLKKGQAGPDDRPPYLHDIPLLACLPQLVADVCPFPNYLLPSWYHEEWWNFSQFFYGSTHSFTPLHFDCLETHNVFFQIAGTKRFVLVDRNDRGKCYVFNWRWSEVDAEQPDFEKHPKFRNARVQEALVGPGDILYMPPGTFHQVRSLSQSISFNIDWHTRTTAVRGASKILAGMPAKNAYFNGVAAVGLWTGVPSKYLYPLYRSYLDYVS
jgi:Cupin-like domain